MKLSNVTLLLLFVPAAGCSPSEPSVAHSRPSGVERSGEMVDATLDAIELLDVTESSTDLSRLEQLGRVFAGKSKPGNSESSIQMRLPDVQFSAPVQVSED